MKNRIRGGADYSDDIVDSDEETAPDNNSEYISIDKFIEDYNNRMTKRGGSEGIVRVYDVKWDDGDDESGEDFVVSVKPAKDAEETEETEDYIVGACEDPEDMIDLIVDRKGGDEDIEVDLDDIVREPLDENDLGDEKILDIDDLLSQYNQKFAEIDSEEVMI
ncbi:hypothetical protein BNJ_00373 [Kaumoebavirus]|uniref:hypothetical protein n=1 Tax=Kaumoebavirus TaxID=1859492 RepID=UPI0009C20539|nr:hypothetical protein BNJ_00373 [Kaumoebavirus]ARA72193.1 hypothetical protein BNJ_00373 [Kaumoebavirus]